MSTKTITKYAGAVIPRVKQENLMSSYGPQKGKKYNDLRQNSWK